MPERSSTLPSKAAALPREALVALIRLYQAVVAPVIPALVGPACGCRFSPSCSQYAVQALRERGVCVGAGLALWRIARCHPFSQGGNDPVPSRRPTCVRIAA